MLQAVRNSIDTLGAVHQDIARTVERASVNSADQIRQQVSDLTEVVQSTGSNLTFHLKSVSDDMAEFAVRPDRSSPAVGAPVSVEGRPMAVSGSRRNAVAGPRASSVIGAPANIGWSGSIVRPSRSAFAQSSPVSPVRSFRSSAIVMNAALSPRRA